MKQKLTLFSVLGWEQRFLLSTEEILIHNEISSVYLICFTDYLEMNHMQANLGIIKNKLTNLGIELKLINLDYENSVSNWHILDAFFKDVQFQDVLMNITTFPRETIWTLLFFLRKYVSSVKYIYYRPESYDKSEGGLTKNHKSPRLLFKHSGVFDINKKLAILITTGFDHNRMDLLIDHFEPEKVVYLSQSGEQYENMDRNCGIEPSPTNESIQVENVKIDNYKINETFETLKKIIDSYSDYNIIISSLGPKTSAISIYLAFLNNNNVALAYVPAREFSGDYSFGIDIEPISGEFSY